MPAGGIEQFRKLTTFGVPVVLVGAYLFLIYSVGATFTVSMFALLLLGIVMVLWFVFRELATHAAIARLIAVGEPDDVVTKARNAIDHRLTRRGKVPFRVYEAIGLGQRGQWHESLAALAEVGPDAAVAWRLAAATARVAALTELGDAGAARAVLDQEVAPLAAKAGPQAHVLVRECEARVSYAENARAVARPLFRAIADDVRIGPAQRAAARLYLARCLLADGDRDAARAELEEARRLAPKTWVKSAADAELGGA